MLISGLRRMSPPCQFRFADTFLINFQYPGGRVQFFLSLYAITYTRAGRPAIVVCKRAISGDYITLWLRHFVAPSGNPMSLKTDMGHGLLGNDRYSYH
jgi:hypothetical protein